MKRAMIPFLLDEVFDDFKAVPTVCESVSISEDEDHLYIKAPVPGVKPDQIQVTFEKGVLWIKGEAHEENKGEKYLYKANSSFSYRVPLPIRVDDQTAPEAVCKDGLLKIAFSKSRSSRPVKIAIKQG